MFPNLDGKRVAILVADGFEQGGLEEPRAALEKANAITYVVSSKNDSVKGWNKVQFGDMIKVDVALQYADSDDYDALLLPGVISSDQLRQVPEAVEFVPCLLRGRQTDRRYLPRPANFN